MQFLVWNASNHPNNKVVAAKSITSAPKAIADDSFHPVSRMSAGNRLLTDNESKPGGVHSILNCGDT